MTNKLPVPIKPGEFRHGSPIPDPWKRVWLGSQAEWQLLTVTEKAAGKCANNTDRELWREPSISYNADRIFLTESGGIGMDVNGYCIVKTIREWHELVDPLPSGAAPAKRKIVAHPTRALQVWVDVDEGVAALVAALNVIPGVRTHASCQGTIGEHGAAPYRAYVEVSWDSEETLTVMARMCFIYCKGKQWGYAHPFGTEGQPDGD